MGCKLQKLRNFCYNKTFLFQFYIIFVCFSKMAFTNASKRAVIELLSDEEVDAELSAPAKKRAKVLKKQGNVSL